MVVFSDTPELDFEDGVYAGACVLPDNSLAFNLVFNQKNPWLNDRLIVVNEYYALLGYVEE